MSEQGDEFYTPEELATRLKVSVQTVRLWLNQGKVRGIKFGRAWRIPADEVARVLREGVAEQE